MAVPGQVLAAPRIARFLTPERDYYCTVQLNRQHMHEPPPPLALRPRNSARILYIQVQSIIHHVEQYPRGDSARHLLQRQRKMKSFENPGVSRNLLSTYRPGPACSPRDRRPHMDLLYVPRGK